MSKFGANFEAFDFFATDSRHLSEIEQKVYEERQKLETFEIFDNFGVNMRQLPMNLSLYRVPAGERFYPLLNRITL